MIMVRHTMSMQLSPKQRENHAKYIENFSFTTIILLQFTNDDGFMLKKSPQYLFLMFYTVYGKAHHA